MALNALKARHVDKAPHTLVDMAVVADIHVKGRTRCIKTAYGSPDGVGDPCHVVAKHASANKREEDVMHARSLGSKHGCP